VHNQTTNQEHDQGSARQGGTQNSADTPASIVKTANDALLMARGDVGEAIAWLSKFPSLVPAMNDLLRTLRRSPTSKTVETMANAMSDVAREIVAKPPITINTPMTAQGSVIAATNTSAEVLKARWRRSRAESQRHTPGV
jgi:hypothetical protein